MQRPRIDPSQKGAEFEAHVAAVYSSLGYKVERNRIVKGQQVDLTLEKTLAGTGRIFLIVECKWRAAGNVSNQEVHDFCNFFARAREQYGFSNGIIVTNTDFTADARSVVEREPFVVLKPVSELERELFDVTDALLYQVHNFETQDIFSHYVPLSGNIFKPEKESIERIQDIASYLCSWASSGEHGLATIMGDFGSGKTTILQRVEFEIAKVFLKGSKSALVPIFFTLRERANFSSLEEYIISTTARRFERKIPIKLFWDQVAMGRVLLLLDGFDEISTKVTSEQRAEMLFDLSPLLAGRSPCILSCRPTYFVRPDEYNELIAQLQEKLNVNPMSMINLATIPKRMLRKYVEMPELVPMSDFSVGEIRVDMLSDRKIDEYLANRNKEFVESGSSDWHSVKEFLLKIYDLKDLMTRPILLSMIADTVIEGRLDSRDDKEISGPSGLYEMYTTLQFERDLHKGLGRRFLTTKQRRHFAQAAALAMLDSKDLIVRYDDICKIADARIGFLPNVEPLPKDATEEQVATDIAVCSFLSKPSEHTFRFVHKSFMEFFIAQRIKALIDLPKDRAWASRIYQACDRVLPVEALTFLANFSLSDNALSPKVVALLEGHQCGIGARRNLHALALLLGSKAQSITFDSQTIASVPFVGYEWKNHTFTNFEFNECTFDRIVCTEVRARDTVLRACRLTQAKFQKCDARIEIVSSQIHNSSFVSGSIKLASVASSIQDAKIDHSDLSLEGEVSISNGTIRGSKINVSGSGSRVRIAGTSIRASRIGCSSFSQTNDVLLYNCDIEDCLMLGVGMTGPDITRLLTQSSEDAPRLCETLKIRGLIIVNSRDSLMQGTGQSNVVKISPSLALINQGIVPMDRDKLAASLEHFKLKFTDYRERPQWQTYLRSVRYTIQ